MEANVIRGKSLLKSWDTTFLPDWQPPLMLAILLELLEHMHKMFEINRTKIKGGCESEVVTHDSKSDLPLDGSGVWKFAVTAIQGVCPLKSKQQWDFLRNKG